jgi:hypothetical protein
MVTSSSNEVSDFVTFAACAGGAGATVAASQ